MPVLRDPTTLAERIATKLETYRQRLNDMEDALQACPVPVVIRDADAEVIIFVNRAYTHWHGLTMEQIKAGKWSDIWLPEDLAHVTAFWNKIKETKDSGLNVRSRQVRWMCQPSGEVKTSRALGRALSSGALVAFIYPEGCLDTVVTGEVVMDA